MRSVGFAEVAKTAALINPRSYVFGICNSDIFSLVSKIVKELSILEVYSIVKVKKYEKGCPRSKQQRLSMCDM